MKERIKRKTFKRDGLKTGSGCPDGGNVLRIVFQEQTTSTGKSGPPCCSCSCQYREQSATTTRSLCNWI